MGEYSSSSNNVQQNINLGPEASLHCQAAYYKGDSAEYVYVWSENDNLRAFPFNRSTNKLDVSNQITSSVAGPSGESGAVLSVSSNSNLPGTGILWASYPSSGNANEETRPGILRAFDAANIKKELWNNSQNASDATGEYAKFCSPTIANGHVYLATFSNQIVVYGLK
jgi:hypothetical protein